MTLTVNEAAQVVAECVNYTAGPPKRARVVADEVIIQAVNGQAFIFTGKELVDSPEFTD